MPRSAAWRTPPVSIGCVKSIPDSADESSSNRGEASRTGERLNGSEDEVAVDKTVARFYAKQLFHLLGFRQIEDAGDRLVMRRRRFDEAARRLVKRAVSSVRDHAADKATNAA